MINLHNLIVSDECPNSGEDSDEDVITDYLSAAQSELPHIPIINGDLTGLNVHVTVSEDANYNAKDNGALLELSEGLDGINHHHDHHHQPESNPIISVSNPLVPIISVTPHSPGMAKHYPVLG